MVVVAKRTHEMSTLEFHLKRWSPIEDKDEESNEFHRTFSLLVVNIFFDKQIPIALALAPHTHTHTDTN